MINALIFDLDDTLFLEKDFVMSGYRAVAGFLAASNACDFEIAFSCMSETYSSEGKYRVFPVLMERFPNPSITLPDLVEVYRQHNPDICLFTGYQDLLQKFAHQYRLGIITDGLPAVQARKVQTLKLECVMDKIIYTWEYGQEKEKPHPFSFSLMLESLQVDKDSALYIGDNPDKDCRGAHNAGMKCAQIQHPTACGLQQGDKAQESPEFVIDSLFQLLQILRHLN